MNIFTKTKTFICESVVARTRLESDLDPVQMNEF